MTIDERQDILAWATALADDAAALAVERVNQAWNVTQKADGTVVTDVDHAVERFIRERIHAQFPEHAVLGEEFGLERADPDAPLWAIDPIDGTTNLANGLPNWGVSIGLIADGEPAVGALNFPLLRERFAAAKGLGATRNGVPLAPLAPGGATTWEDTYAICSYSVRRVDFQPIECRLRILGSAALEICWTAAGLVRGCQSIGVSLYDVAAGMCVAAETGAFPAWLLSDDRWSALDMLENGKRENDALMVAPPATQAFLRERLRIVR